MFDKSDELKALTEAAGVRVTTDYRDNYTPGWKYNFWCAALPCLYHCICVTLQRTC